MSDTTVPAIVSKGHVAVVTGAALGIGRALCQRLASDGMSVCLADLPGDDLDAALADVRSVSTGGDDSVMSHPTDVAAPEQIAQLRDAVIKRFGRVDMLVNNAVTRMGRGHDADLSEWRTAFDVNVWGPVAGVRAFLPTMQAPGAQAMIINVGSKQGITNPPGHPIYNMAKSALKTYTEALEHELRSHADTTGGARVSAHLLVPGWTTTGTAEHKPGAWRPDQVVDVLLAALARGDFYIVCPDDEVSPDMDRRRILWGAEDIVENRPPLSRWHPDFAAAAKTAGC
ncbi:MAG: SDR family NAD(P)-dependent oxidoreductase [Pseudomonadota bacterium]